MQWLLENIYHDFNKWSEDLKKFQKDITIYKEYKGKLHNLKTFKKFMAFDTQMEKNLAQLFTYATMNYDLNQKDIQIQEYYGLVYQVYNEYSIEASFVTSEIIAIGQKKIDEWLGKDQSLSEYAFLLNKIFKNQKHILDAKSEMIMANYNAVISNYKILYEKLSIGDNNDVVVVLNNKDEITVNDSNLALYLETLTDKEDRKKVFEAIYSFYEKHKNTYASIYNGIIEANISILKNRNYNDLLEVFLQKNQIPSAVYLSLIDVCKKNTGAVKRYYELIKKHFKLSVFNSYDRFLTLKKSDKTYPYTEAKNIFLESVKQIGGEFAKYAKEVIDDGRVDVYYKDGKRRGAYSTSYYENGPYILLNYNDQLEDLFTLVHEAGHSIHSLFSNENQPYHMSNYTIFIAEIASIFNEHLLLDYLIEKNKGNHDLKINLLQKAIDGIIQTFYRQALFADYEYQAHMLVVNNIPITATQLTKIMKNLYLNYYNIDFNNEPLKENVWAHIPHFFESPFYVYQYATSYAASYAIYEQVIAKKPKALEKYITLLKSGDSAYPTTLLKQASIDLENGKAYQAIINRLEYLVDKLEKELA